MSSNDEKTIPYRLSQAELENLRLLRKRTNPSAQQDPDDQPLSPDADTLPRIPVPSNPNSGK